jgi:hypothetical protein
MLFSPSTGTFYTNAPFRASNLYAQNAVGIGGASPTPPGTTGFGGYFTGVGAVARFELLCVLEMEPLEIAAVR